MSVYTHLLPLIAGYAVTLSLLRWVVFSRKQQPVSATAWILAIIFIPILGGILFLLFGTHNIHRRREGKLAAARDLAKKLPKINQFELRDLDLTPQQNRLALLISRECSGVLTGNNTVEIIAETLLTQQRIEEAILGAKHTLDLEYYIWQPDRTGTRVRDMLIARAQAGVKVRFLYDSLGSMALNWKFLGPMIDAGIQAVPFLPGSTFRERWSFNNRCHRKIVIVDGTVGFTGGMNIGDEYLGARPDIGYWRDTHLRIEGPSVWQLQQVFAEDWYYSTGEELTDEALFPPPRCTGHGITQVVSGGPDGVREPFHMLAFAAINEARESITITTSYFAPTFPLIMALETAAARGIKVRIMVAGKSVYPWTVWVGRSFYDTLLRAGVEIFEYKKGIMHAKTMTIDGVWSLVGTANFDYRSMLLNFEVALALYGEGYARELEAQFLIDQGFCSEVRLADWDARSLSRVFAENVCRLIAPVV